MSIGQRRHYSQLQSKVEAVDEIGQPSTSWVLDRMVWADIKHLTGLSTIKSGVDVSVTRVSIRVPHGAFNAGQRIVYENAVYEIDSVIPDGRRKEIDLVCRTLNVAS